MNRFIFAFTIIICNCGFLFSQSKPIPTGNVRGIIYSLDRESIVNMIEITVIGDGIKRTLNLNFESEEYGFILPVGTYDITIKENIWYAVKRASFRVEAGRTTIVNLYLALRVRSVLLTLDGDEYQYNPAPKYDSLNVDGLASDIVAEFSEQNYDDESLQYKKAKLTFDNQTMLADLIIYDKKSKIFELKGDVLFDDNGQRARTNQARIKLENGRLTVISQK